MQDSSAVDTKHYSFKVKLTEEELETGYITLDPYRVALEWNTGGKDPSGCLFHMLKNIARFGMKVGNSREREAAALQSTLNRFKELNASSHT